MKNINLRNSVIAAALGSSIVLNTLTGCALYPDRYAIIFGEDTATIIPIDSYIPGKNRYFLHLNDGTEIVTSSNDTKIVEDMDQKEMEELIVNIMGDDVTINYWGEEVTYTRE